MRSRSAETLRRSSEARMRQGRYALTLGVVQFFDDVRRRNADGAAGDEDKEEVKMVSLGHGCKNQGPHGADQLFIARPTTPFCIRDTHTNNAAPLSITISINSSSLPPV